MLDRTLTDLCETMYFPLKLSIRSDHTRNQYRYAIGNLAKVLARVPIVEDLTDDHLIILLKTMVDTWEIGIVTANERVGRLKSLWTWLAKRGILHRFPTVGRLPAPERIPRAWTKDELARLFAACRSVGGRWIADIRPSHWWTAFHAWLWNTGERRGATMALRWEHLDLSRGLAIVPPEIRKGQRKMAVYQLWPQTCELLDTIREPSRDLVFPFPYDDATYYSHYRKLLESAGLPTGRKHCTHAMRVSFATWLHVGGQDATTALKHSDPATTRGSYLDPRQITPEAPQLWCPWDEKRSA